MTGFALFVVMALAAFRVTRFVTTDEVTRPARETSVRWLQERRWHLLADLPACAWCAGAYVSVLTVGLTGRWASIPLPALQMIAIATLVGLLSGRMENQ